MNRFFDGLPNYFSEGFHRLSVQGEIQLNGFHRTGSLIWNWSDFDTHLSGIAALVVSAATDRQVEITMLFSVIYSVDVPEGEDIFRFAPPNFDQLWYETEGDESNEYSYLEGRWENG